MYEIIVLCFLGDPTLDPASEPGTGGFNLDSAELVKILSETDYDVTFITNTSANAQRPTERLADNIVLNRIPVPMEAIKNQNLLINLEPDILSRVEEIMDRKHSLSMIHSLYWFSGHLAAILSQKYRIPFVHTTVSLAYGKILSNVKPKCCKQEDLEKVFFQKASMILAITASEVEFLTQHYQIDKSKILLVGRSVGLIQQISGKDSASSQLEVSQYCMKAADYDKIWHMKAFTYVGRIVPDKGVKNIILSWYQLYKKNPCIPPLWIVGGNSTEIALLHDDIKEIIPEIDVLLEDMKICFWGFLNYDFINNILLRTLVLIEHSQYEAGGRVIMEAFSTGTPVIATPYGFARDYISDWKNGFLVNYGDTETLSYRMSLFIRNNLLSLVLGNSAFDTYVRCKREWNYVQKHLDIYASFCKNNGILHTDTPLLQPGLYHYFNKGMIYKYPDPEVNLAKFIEEHYDLFDTQSQPQRTNNSYGKSIIWSARAYYFKFIYSVFNAATLWNKLCKEKILRREDNLQKLYISASLSCVSGIICADDSLSILCTMKLELIEKGTILEKLDKIISLLCKFNRQQEMKTDATKQRIAFRCNDFSTDNDNSLKSFWNEVLVGTDWEQHPVWLHDNAAFFAEKAGDSASKFVLNYGKPILEHIVIENDIFYLLPSASVFYGEYGYDIGQLLYELLSLDGSTNRLPYYLLKFVESFDISGKSLITWTALMAVIQQIREDIFVVKTKSDSKSLLETLQSAWYHYN